MANANVGFGLKPINTAGSTPATSGTNAYFIDSQLQARSFKVLRSSQLTTAKSLSPVLLPVTL